MCCIRTDARTLNPLATARVPESLVYRALLVAILERAYPKAYGHGARYLMRLRELVLKSAEVQGLVPSYAEFEVSIRQ